MKISVLQVPPTSLIHKMESRNPGIYDHFPEVTYCLPCFCKFNVFIELQCSNNNSSSNLGNKNQICTRSTFLLKGFSNYPLYMSQYSGDAREHLLIYATILIGLCIAITWCYKKKIVKSVVPLLRLFLMSSMMPLELERCVVTENDLIALLRNDAWNKLLMS